jgi:hypothetical protein
VNEPLAGADHERYAPDVAGYVLGGLSVAEQRAFEAHLATCEVCREELDQLDPIPVLLALSTDPTPVPVPVPVVATAESTEAPMSGARPRSAVGTRRVLAGIAVSVLAMAAAFLIGLSVAAPTDPGYSQAVALHAAAANPSASGTVAVRPVTHGTEVRLNVRGLPAGSGTYYECLWWSNSGVRSAGTFTVTATGATGVELTTAAELHPGWRLAILEHPGGRSAPVTVLETST